MPSPGEVLSDYRLVERIGTRSKGHVWRAVDTKSSGDVALRMLPFASDPARLARFRFEMKALADLHPAIVTAQTVEESGGEHFAVMPCVLGKTLSQTIPTQGMALNPLLELAIPLTEAVHAAHEHRIIHGDLHPGNIIIAENGTPRILDFGLTASGGGDPDAELDTDDMPTETLTQAPSGGPDTLPYSSPERLQAKPLDHRADVYSMGAVLYKMATGQAPFTGESAADVIVAILRDVPRQASELKPDVPAKLDADIARAMGKDRRRRLQSVQFLSDSLSRLAE